MQKRILTPPRMDWGFFFFAVGLILSVGVLASAQNARSPVPLEEPRMTLDANRVATSGEQTTFSGGVVIVVNGVRVSADRAVRKGEEVAHAGNVRLTLPKRNP